jgi:hypothetical protein
MFEKWLWKTVVVADIENDDYIVFLNNLRSHRVTANYKIEDGCAVISVPIWLVGKAIIVNEMSNAILNIRDLRKQAHLLVNPNEKNVDYFYVSTYGALLV